MKKIISISFVFFVVVISGIGIVRYIIQSNPPPKSVNMGSTMTVGKLPTTMSMVGQEPVDKDTISVDSLLIPDDSIPIKKFILTAEVVKRNGMPDEWTYNGTVPGPQIRVTQGDHVCVILRNHLPVATTIHWHGIQVPNGSDGVAGLTQDAVKPGQSYMYDFIAKEPGTYWFHSHQLTSEQEPKGLFGSLIIDPKNGILYDHDYTLIYHDMITKPLTPLQIIWQRIQQFLGKHIPQNIAINNKTHEILKAQPNQTIRIRIINASGGDMTGAPLSIVPVGVQYKILALDGHDINNPQNLSAKVLQVGQGQRYDLFFTMPASGSVALVDLANNETATIGTGVITLPQNVQKLPIFDLTKYGSAVPHELTISSHFDRTYPIILGEKPGFRTSKIELIHTINGKAFPDVPMITVMQGQVIHFHIVNTTNEYHPMHLHGHIFTVLQINGKNVSGSPMHLDSVLVGPKETADVAFIADNPGLWMFHCHVLIHAEFGMDMMVVYPNIATPYTVGTLSGNFPD